MNLTQKSSLPPLRLAYWFSHLYFLSGKNHTIAMVAYLVDILLKSTFSELLLVPERHTFKVAYFFDSYILVCYVVNPINSSHIWHYQRLQDSQPDEKRNRSIHEGTGIWGRKNKRKLCRMDYNKMYCIWLLQKCWYYC